MLTAAVRPARRAAVITVLALAYSGAAASGFLTTRTTADAAIPHAAIATVAVISAILALIGITIVLRSRAAVGPDEADSETLAQRRVEEELHSAYMIHGATDLIWRLAPDGTCRYVSPASTTMLHREPEEMLGRSIYDFVHPDDAEEQRELQAMLIAEAGSSTLTYRAVRKDGSSLWLETTSRAIRDTDSGEVSEIVATSRDISDRKLAEEQIEYQAYHDPLTGLPNRILFEDRAAYALAQARRFDRKLAILFLDLNRFKNVNDGYGHTLGDQLLQEVAWRIKNTLRDADTVARIGGDEFTVLVPDLEDVDDAGVVAQKLLDRFDSPFVLGSEEFFIGGSIGIAIYPNDGDDCAALLRAADGAMYRAKQVGGNNFQYHTADLSTSAVERLSLERELRRAIEKREFRVYYQPQIELGTDRIASVEALVRWEHPTRGIVMPDDFIYVAEDCGLISQIGELVLRDGCLQVKQWQETTHPGLRLAVNLSARQFRDRGLVDLVRRVLDETGFDPQLLELEITEGTAMQSAERAIEIIRLLKEMAIRITIDDFGIGYSSLSYLKRFPVDNLKIDKSFVFDIARGGAENAIVSAVINMTHALNLNVVAEGVETEYQREFLTRESCDLFQGFLFSEPVPAEEFERQSWRRPFAQTM